LLFILDYKMETELEKMEMEIRLLNELIREYTSNKKSEKEINILEDELCELEFRRNSMIELHNLQMNCDHVFIEDLIDLTPDKSKTIEYCAHCMFQKQ